MNRLITCLVPGIVLLAASVQAQDRQPVFLVIGQEPYSYEAPDGEMTGYHFEIANRILAEAGYEPDAVAMPLKRLIRDVKQGKADCMLAAKSPFAQQNFTVIEPIGHDLVVGIMPRAGIDLNQYADLYNIKVGIPAGMSIGQPFDSDEKIQKVDTPDYPRSVQMLRSGRIDAIMGAFEGIRFSASRVLAGTKIAFGKPLETRRYPVTLLCNNEIAHSSMVQNLKMATQRLKARNGIRKIIGAFF